MIEDLTAIAEKIDNLLPQFRGGGALSGLILPTEHAAKFKALIIDAKSILDQEMGLNNDFSSNLVHAVNSGAGGFFGGPSYASVQETAEIVRAAVKAINRKRVQQPASAPVVKPYVDPSRLTSLQSMNGGTWDFTRLFELCREINVAHEHRCYLATAMILRTIMNHIPPVLGYKSFAEVASNYGGPRSDKSFKANMQRLETSLRSIADTHLHSPIRSREDVPTAIQVDFSADLDVLLGEVIRVAGGNS